MTKSFHLRGKILFSGGAAENQMPPDPEPKELHYYSCLGNDFRERELIKKKHRSLTSKIAMLEPLERN